MNSNPLAKRILCYGDSYTWGYMPGSNYERWPADVRWTGILQTSLGNTYEIVEEGLNSRTLTSLEIRPGKEGRSGKQYLIPCLDSHDPLDLVILFLGTNELKDRYAMSAQDIGNILETEFVKVILGHTAQNGKGIPRLLIVSPPILNLDIPYAYTRYSQAKDKNLALAQIYPHIAARWQCGFIDAAAVVGVGSDGVHLDQEANRVFGEALAQKVMTIVAHNKE